MGSVSTETKPVSGFTVNHVRAVTGGFSVAGAVVKTMLSASASAGARCEEAAGPASRAFSRVLWGFSSGSGEPKTGRQLPGFSRGFVTAGRPPSTAAASGVTTYGARGVISAKTGKHSHTRNSAVIFLPRKTKKNISQQWLQDSRLAHLEFENCIGFKALWRLWSKTE